MEDVDAARWRVGEGGKAVGGAGWASVVVVVVGGVGVEKRAGRGRRVLLV